MKRKLKIKNIADRLINGEKVSRWEVMPYRFDLRVKLKDNEEALHELEIMIECALGSV